MRTRLHRNVSEPYTKNLRRLQEVHRTLSESASYHSAADDMTKTSRVARRPSLKRPDWNPNDSGSSKKSVTWIDKEIPGRSISEFHLITPRSFRMQQYRDRALPSSGGGGGAGSQAQSRVSLHVNQQLQYYYYHQKAGKSSACSTCMSSLRAFWWGV